MWNQNYQTLALVTLILAIISLALNGWLGFLFIKIYRLKNTLFSGQNAGNLESLIYRVSENIQGLHNNQINLESQLEELRKQLQFAVQKVGLIRFNPFADGGGNFSFCLAMLDNNSSGLILTSMHGREQNRIYIKKLIKGVSEQKLTEEELKAIAMAATNPLN